MINIRNLSKVSKINRRRFGQEQDTYYLSDVAKIKSTAKSQRPKSNYQNSNRAMKIEFSNTQNSGFTGISRLRSMRKIKTAQQGKRSSNRNNVLSIYSKFES